MVDLNAGYSWTASGSKIIIHENFNAQTLLNDIALIKTLESAPSDGELKEF
jgi:hypothetical protein